MAPSVSLRLPEGWVEGDPPPELVLVAHAPGDDNGFRTNVCVVAVERETDDSDTYVDGVVSGAVWALRRCRAIDAQAVDQSDFRFTFAFQHEETRVTSLQRHVWADGAVVIATFTCPTTLLPAAYPDALRILDGLEVTA